MTTPNEPDESSPWAPPPGDGSTEGAAPPPGWGPPGPPYATPPHAAPPGQPPYGYGPPPYGAPPGAPPHGYGPPGQPWGYGGPYGYPAPVNTNGFAIAAFVCAFLCSPLGIVFGAVALSQINRTGERGRGLAIAGLVISALSIIVGIALFAAAVSTTDGTVVVR